MTTAIRHGHHHGNRHRTSRGTPAVRRPPASGPQASGCDKFCQVMDFRLSDDQELLRRAVREFAEAEIGRT